MNYKLLVCFALLGMYHTTHGIFRTNVLLPYNILLQPDYTRETLFALTCGYEGVLAAHGFAAHRDGKQNVLQIFQCEQDALAALKGAPSESDASQYAQLFNLDDDNDLQGLYTPCGKFSVPVNALFGLHIRLAENVTLRAYTSYLQAELSHVTWTQKNGHLTFNCNQLPDLLETVAQLGNLNLCGWKRHGFGDTVVQAAWQNDFFQRKQYLRNVRLAVRGGLLLPTGKRENINDLEAFSFGYGQGVGVIFAGTLGLHFMHNIRLRLDLEFLQCLGNTRTRRIATDPAQTDLLFINTATIFVDPGFNQQYTFMFEKLSIWEGLHGMIAYQYFKHNDDVYYPCTNAQRFDILNNSQDVQEWTTHQLFFKANYEFNHESDCGFRPNLAVFGKYGFNGKRAIITSSLGASISFAY